MRKINNEHQRIKEETGAFSSQYRIIQHITTLKEIRKSALRREMKRKVNLFKEKCVEEMAFQKLLGFSFLSFLLVNHGSHDRSKDGEEPKGIEELVIE